MKFKFSSWPFPVDMPAHLCWVNSPMQVGEHKQWQSEVLFRGQNGQYHKRVVPWGGIQSLKLGGVYVNGAISESTPAGEVTEFKLSKNATFHVHSLEELKNQWLGRVCEFKKEFLWERCVCIVDGETRLWVPCIEIIRSFFAINKQMAYLLLEPGGLLSICTSELENGRVRIHFNNGIPVSTLNSVLVTRIATIIHHSVWWDCWQQVWNRSIKNPNDQTVYSKLFCRPPIVKDSTWSVRGIPSEDGFFVLEVLGLRTEADVPFFEVTYTHPRLTISQEDAVPTVAINEPGNSGKPRDGNSANGEIDPEAKSPKEVSNPLRESIAVSTVKFGNSIRVIKQHENRKPKPRKTKSPKQSGPKPSSPVDGQTLVSMDDEAGTGEIRAAEFMPIEKLAHIPPGLKAFIAFVNKMPMVKVGCTIEPVPGGSSLAKLSGGQRHFALVHIIGANLEGHLLEIDSSDGRKISTMIFTPTNGHCSLETAKSLLVECLARGGCWSLDAINGDIVRGYKLAKHTINWGTRLRLKTRLLVQQCEKTQTIPATV